MCRRPCCLFPVLAAAATISPKTVTKRILVLGLMCWLVPFGRSIELHDINTLYDATNRYCHSEQREESLRETLRCAQGDIPAVPVSCGLIQPKGSERMKIQVINPNTSLAMTESIGVAVGLVARSGCCDRVGSIRPTPLYALGLEKDPGKALQTGHAEARRAKDEDDAEGILLGCAGFAQFDNELEGELHIPVLDGVVCAVKMAEAIVELGKTTSKYKTYRFPEGKAFAGMFAKFGRP